MELSALCPPLPGRPLFVTYEGGRVYISAHDHFHLEKKREFKRRIRVGHPDVNRHNSASGHVRKLLKLRERWRKNEIKWYAKFGLEPPGMGRARCNEPKEETLLLAV